MPDDPTDDRREYDESLQLPIKITTTCELCGKSHDVDFTGFSWRYVEQHLRLLAKTKPWCNDCKAKEWAKERKMTRLGQD
jgi:hypothetical protein